MRRERIVTAALKLILKRGYDRTTLDQVAAEAGVSKGLVSYHFTKKDDLFLAVLDQMLVRLQTDLEGCCKEDSPAWDQVTMNMRNLFGSERRTRSYYTVLVEFLGQASRKKSVREHTQIIYQTHLSYMERAVMAGVRSGQFKAVDPHAAASMLVAMMEGLILQWLYNPERLSLSDAYLLCERFARDLFLPAANDQMIEAASGGATSGVAGETT